MAYAVCRIEKIKSWAQLGSSALHSTRERETPNANPSVNNIRLIDSAGEKDLLALFKERIGNQKIRSNAVLGVEMLLSASAEYFRPDDPTAAGVYDQKRLEDFTTAATQWLLAQHKNLVVRAELHLDEATPHIHAYIVPLDKKGKLNYRALYGGSKTRLSELQTSFAAAVQHLGIERGIKGSKATHTDIQDYYTDVNRDSLNLNLEQTLPIPKSQEPVQLYRERVKETLQPQLDIINHQLSDRQWAIRAYQQMEQKALASEQERQKLEQRVQNLEWSQQLWKTEVNLLRDLPLEDVAYHLGLYLDDKGKHRWKGHGHIINIKGSKFYDFAGEERGGGGAIDLVMHVLDSNFRQAVAWLYEQFGESGMQRAVTHHARTQAQEIAQKEPTPRFVPPQADESRWLTVQQYLTVTRKLPLNLVDTLHSLGLIYADNRQNATFIMRSLKGEVTGAFLRGTYDQDNSFIGFARGTKRTKGWFHLTIGGNISDSIGKAVLVKSPIDALSLAVLDQSKSERTLYLAADSPRCLPVGFLSKIPRVIAAYDNDAAGNDTSVAIKEILPHTTRLKPKAKDWNEQLTQHGFYNRKLQHDQAEP
ncbi:plasmid recombination protein [Brasilonema sp. CT11]|nr:plasmid recombination protein [Brasilonema sp. CT11]